VLETCNEAGITEQAYCRWRGQFGHLSVDQIRRMKDLEEENRKLRSLVAELTLDLTLE
jgi:putative transposase